MVMRRAPAGDDVTMVRMDEPTSDTTTPVAPLQVAVQEAPLPVATNEWTVRRGDHLWSIAARVLGERTGHQPTDRDTDPFWRRLILANHDLLADPNNPDLIFPGQVLVIPS
jgi:nucleoid-associated protein YgaU